MSQLIEEDTINHFRNPRAQLGVPIGARQRAILSQEGLRAAREEIRTWPVYASTPLISLHGLAEACRVGKLYYKNEARRFGLKSFKALGGSYAVLQLLLRHLPRGATSHDLLTGQYREETSQITVCCATDGNHGRSVAWGAQQFGARCVIYLHSTVSKGREDAIAHLGAEVRRVGGSYDDAVSKAALDAEENGWFVVADTAYPGYMTVPKDVMQGYTVMADEVVQQVSEPPTHCFVQGGVGGFAAAVLAQLWEAYGEHRPRLILVEPDRAACLYESARQGSPTEVPGELDTLMAGLACGNPSLLAWEIIDEGIDDFITVTDGAAVEAMRLLAQGVNGDSPLVAGESAVAGLVGLLIARQRAELSDVLALDANSRVLVFGCEGATDEAIYHQLVGKLPNEIEERPRDDA